MLAGLPGGQPLLVLLGGIVGAVLGSFIGALVTRWPRGESVVGGRSACDACGHRLTPTELVPVLSFALQRGRCRVCHAEIAPTHVVAELACALVGATAFLVAPPAAAALGLLFGCTLVALAMLDALHLWLPDRLTLFLAATGFGASAAGLGVAPGDSLIGAAAGHAVLAGIAAFYKRVRGRTGMGGGDPKLFGAIGAWVGWAMLPPVLLLASLAGLGIVAIRNARGTPLSPTDKLPLGTLLAVAAWPAWLIMAALRPG